jgi:hypothetical protein
MFLVFHKKLHCIFKLQMLPCSDHTLINQCAQEIRNEQDDDYGNVLELDYRGTDKYRLNNLHSSEHSNRNAGYLLTLLPVHLSPQTINTTRFYTLQNLWL